MGAHFCYFGDGLESRHSALLPECQRFLDQSGLDEEKRGRAFWISGKPCHTTNYEIYLPSDREIPLATGTLGLWWSFPASRFSYVNLQGEVSRDALIHRGLWLLLKFYCQHENIKLILLPIVFGLTR